MVDHEERQILQKLEDDALANARRKAQEDAQQPVPTDEDNPTSGDAVPLEEDDTQGRAASDIAFGVDTSTSTE